jgi:hypothetical protein
LNSVFHFHNTALPDVYSKYARRPVGEKPAADRRCSLVVKTRPIYKCTIRRQTEKSWLRVAGLRMVGNCTDFNEAKAERSQGRSGMTILVEASGQANGIAEIKTEPPERSERGELESPLDSVPDRGGT